MSAGASLLVWYSVCVILTKQDMLEAIISMKAYSFGRVTLMHTKQAYMWMHMRQAKCMHACRAPWLCWHSRRGGRAPARHLSAGSQTGNCCQGQPSLPRQQRACPLQPADHAKRHHTFQATVYSASLLMAQTRLWSTSSRARSNSESAEDQTLDE